MRLAVIPARGGSKRIPGKNTRSFCGQPIIKYSIDAALHSRLFDHVIVSTDDDEIARIAVQCGADVPFSRPSHLSNDTASIMPVLRHAIEWTQRRRGEVDQACCIYATAPFILPEQLVKADSLLRQSSDAEFVLPITTFDYAPHRALSIEDGSLRFLWPEHSLTHSQHLVEAVHDAGLFFYGRSSSFFEYDSTMESRCLPLMVPRYRAVDIDTAEDWEFAEKLFLAGRSESSHN